MTVIPARPGVTWVDATDTTTAGWLPVIDDNGTPLRVPDVAPVPPVHERGRVRLPGQDDVYVVYATGEGEAERVARHLVWRVDGAQVTPMLFDTAGGDDAAVPVRRFDNPTVRVERDCHGCKTTLPGAATECPKCRDEALKIGDPYEPDLGERELVCPACETAGQIADVDVAERATTITVADDDPNVLVAHYDGNGDYHSDHYECEACCATVDLPDHLTLAP